MRYVIFGCGTVGKAALHCIGESRVKCFCDNNQAGKTVCGKPILSFQETRRECEADEALTLVIASETYRAEMEAQVKAANIERYFVFHTAEQPRYMRDREVVCPGYAEILSHYQLEKYRKIAVYGIRDDLSWLLHTIQEQSPKAEVILVPQSADVEIPETVSCPISPLESALAEIDCLILNFSRQADPQAVREWGEKVPCDVIDLYAIDQFEPAFHYEGMEAFRNIHAGKRVFIIGNGPSLTIEDLNTLHEHGEICFGFNKVYRVYNRTPWRADYLGFSDHRAIEDCEADMPSLPGQLILSDAFHVYPYPYKHFSNVHYFHINREKFYPNYPNFSDNPSKVMYVGGTVIYTIGIQLAAYMGFHEIYLLGVDHSMNGSAGRPENHFISDYHSTKEKEKYKNVYFQAEKAIRAYEKAELYSRTHGFRIFNATRGGKLEVFERIDFDSLF